LAIYHNPQFGKRLKPELGSLLSPIAAEVQEPGLPTIGLLVEFIHSFQDMERSPQAAIGKIELL
jgi:hypothetical protein